MNDDDAARFEITLPDLAAMFRRSATKGRCPDETILKDFPVLRSTNWVRRLIAFENDRKPTADRTLREALTVVQSSLVPVIRLYTLLWNLNVRGFDQETLEPLVYLHELVPDTLAVLPVRDRRRNARSAGWHGAAELVADEAMQAWRLAGRTRFGVNPTSPVVRFTHEFLATAGVHQDAGTIAMAFQRGVIGRRSKRPTTGRSRL